MAERLEIYKCKACGNIVEVLSGGAGTLTCCGASMELLEEKTADAATEKPDKGEVLAVGKGKILENGDVRPMDLAVGDKILFGKYAGTAIKVEGDELLVMREDDVMAVIE